ncbi:hypothetical protein [Gaetbulibacter jejuensis]|uniref:Uncharacterized protein n=1 Tax=Gaetbulibacter jejuensis TaxID=584607 RepID=A0ABN1JN56_9FLAO
MKTICYITIISLFFACSNKNEKDSTKYNSNELINITYDDYIRDLGLVKSLKSNDCKIIMTLFDSLKTIDAKGKLLYEYKNYCKNLSLDDMSNKANESLINQLSDIMYKDQAAREEFNDVVKKQGLQFPSDENYAEKLRKRQFYWDSIVKKSDSINVVKFSKIIDSVGEWLGYEYLARTPQNPNIGILIGHMPEKQYVKYTKMALESAKRGKEYWSRVERIIGYSKKYYINDIEYMNIEKFITPFRFIDYKKTGLIDEDSDLTKLEFKSIASVKLMSESSEDLFYELSSSVLDDTLKNSLLNQAKDILIKYGWKENLIKINFNTEPHDEYKLYYQIVY